MTLCKALFIEEECKNILLFFIEYVIMYSFVLAWFCGTPNLITKELFIPPLATRCMPATA